MLARLSEGAGRVGDAQLAASLVDHHPLSIPMILYAALADTSVIKLFLAGFVPGFIGGGMLTLHGLWLCAPL